MRIIDLTNPCGRGSCHGYWASLNSLLYTSDINYVRSTLRDILTEKIQQCPDCKQLVNKLTSPQTGRLYRESIYDVVLAHDFMTHRGHK